MSSLTSVDDSPQPTVDDSAAVTVTGKKVKKPKKSKKDATTVVESSSEEPAEVNVVVESVSTATKTKAKKDKNNKTKVRPLESAEPNVETSFTSAVTIAAVEPVSPTTAASGTDESLTDASNSKSAAATQAAKDKKQRKRDKKAAQKEQQQLQDEAPAHVSVAVETKPAAAPKTSTSSVAHLQATAPQQPTESVAKKEKRSKKKQPQQPQANEQTEGEKVGNVFRLHSSHLFLYSNQWHSRLFLYYYYDFHSYVC